MPSRIPYWLGTAALACVLVSPAAPATGAASPAVALSGILGSKALLVVDGTAPRALAAGERHLGVTVVSVGREEAVIERDGARYTVRLGEAPVSVGSRGGASPGASGSQRVLLAGDSQGHFVGSGQINGQAMQFMVDTGATTVAVGAPEARRLGLAYENGVPVRMGTATGVAQGWRLRLDSVRIGALEVRNVDAVVMPHALPYVLLGNSFLRGVQMSRNNEQMVLEKRP